MKEQYNQPEILNVSGITLYGFALGGIHTSFFVKVRKSVI